VLGKLRIPVHGVSAFPPGPVTRPEGRELTGLRKDDRLTAAISNPVSDPPFGFLLEVGLVESRRELSIWLGGLMRTLHLIAISGLIAGTTALHAQKQLSQDEMASHLMTWVAPVYPTIAQAAQAMYACDMLSSGPGSALTVTVCAWSSGRSTRPKRTRPAEIFIRQF
jgi:hypothetical protein